jgi:hypothetical protein
MEEIQSNSRFVHSPIEVKSWLCRLPAVDAVRPPSCPCCGSAGRPTGKPLVIHGHGLRPRDQWGSGVPGAASAVGEVLCRRFRCLACRAVFVVAPGGVLPRRRYSATAIALALALWGIARLPPREVRSRVSPWRILGSTAVAGWASLRRWARAVRGGRLFAGVRVLPGGASLREVAARAATSLAARAPTCTQALSLEIRACIGACK